MMQIYFGEDTAEQAMRDQWALEAAGLDEPLELELEPFREDELVRLVKFFESDYLFLKTISIDEPAPFSKVKDEYDCLVRTYGESDHENKRDFRIVREVPLHWLEGYTFKNGRWGMGEHW